MLRGFVPWGKLLPKIRNFRDFEVLKPTFLYGTYVEIEDEEDGPCNSSTTP